MVGRLSVLLLIIFTLSDVALNVVHAQMHTMDSHTYYNALSPDVIRPAFLYKVTHLHHHHHPEKKPLNLGTAAISRITDALSPILPFTGGVDLRRKEYYSEEGWFGNLKTIVRETYEAYANAKESDANLEESASVKVAKKVSRGGGQLPQRLEAKLSKKRPQRPSVLSATNSFVKVDEIAELTLTDLTQLFEYAVKSTQDGFNFNKGRFGNSQSPRVKSVIQQMENAATKSRGNGIQLVKTTADGSVSGDVDAFLFCAAMRIFAEWRVVRLVPDGYKGYAVGMQLGWKDVVQNVGKIEKALHAWIDHQLDLGYSENDISSPTLRDLLQFEKDTNVNPREKLPRLKDGTGSMGLLWTKRQFDYQFEIFKKTLEVPTKYSTAKDAVTAAYTTVYGAYHGWGVQKIFSYSFSASPEDITEIYKVMNPRRLRDVEEAARHIKASPKQSDASQEQEDDASGIGEEVSYNFEPPKKLTDRIGWEVDRLLANTVGKIFAGDKSGIQNNVKVRGGGQVDSGFLQGDELEAYISSEMTKDANEHISSFIGIAEPLAKDLTKLFDELNMNDPTKV
mgnify:CR=1 FL=1